MRTICAQLRLLNSTVLLRFDVQLLCHSFEEALAFGLILQTGLLDSWNKSHPDLLINSCVLNQRDIHIIGTSLFDTNPLSLFN